MNKFANEETFPWGIKGREVLGGLGMKRDDIKNVCVGDSVVLQKKINIIYSFINSRKFEQVNLIVMRSP